MCSLLFVEAFGQLIRDETWRALCQTRRTSIAFSERVLN